MLAVLQSMYVRKPFVVEGGPDDVKCFTVNASIEFEARDTPVPGLFHMIKNRASAGLARYDAWSI